MEFKIAVENTPDVNSCLQRGLRALGADSAKINMENTSLCGGSVNIDSCLSNLYPQSNRWDYCFAYNGEVFFVEVHSAITSEVSTVIKKLNWLKNWLANEAPDINALKAKSKPPYYWIQASNFSILPNSKQYRVAVQEGIKPISRLEL